MKHRTPLLLVLALVMIATGTSTALATPVVRILFFTGNVSVKSGGTTNKARIGQMLEAKDEVTLTGNATLQLSVDGKVVKYTKPAKVKVADAIKRAGSGENLVVANTVRTLAGASGADRNDRTSVAGATRADDSSQILTQVRDKAVDEAGRTVEDEITRRTGIENPGQVLTDARNTLAGQPLLVLEPRSTAVPGGPITFRWLRNPDVTSLKVTVKDYMGEEVFSQTTTDTFVVWQNPTLLPEAIYSWSLDDPGNVLRTASASFHQLSADATGELQRGEADIKKELGKDNPALPLILGAYYSDHGCYGAAARAYTSGAMQTREHRDEFMERAVEEYRYNMFMTPEEVQRIYRR
jgi:hypothetical protein